MPFQPSLASLLEQRREQLLEVGEASFGVVLGIQADPTRFAFGIPDQDVRLFHRLSQNVALADQLTGALC